MRLRHSLALFALLSGCLDPTQMTVEFGVDAPLACDGGDLIVGDLDVYSGRGAVDLTEPTVAHEPSCRASSFGDIVFTPDGAADEGSPVRVVALAQVTLPGQASDRAKCVSQLTAAREGKATCVPPLEAKPDDEACEPCIASSASFGFVPHTRLAFRMSLTAECRGVFCKAGQTCGASGTCVDDTVTCSGERCGLGGSGGAGGDPVGGQGGAMGGSGGAGATGGSGGAGGVTGFTRLANVDGQVNDVVANAVSGKVIVFVAAASGFHRCDTATGTCESLNASRAFHRVDASSGVAFALTISSTPPSVDSTVLSSDAVNWTLDSCTEGSRDVAYRDGSAPGVLNSLDNDSQLTFFESGGCSMIPSNMSECAWLSALPGDRYVAACEAQMVVFQSTQAIYNTAAVDLLPTSLASVPLTMGERHFVCSGTLRVFNSFATSIVGQTLVGAPACSFASAVSHDRLFLYDKPTSQLLSYPFDLANDLSLASVTSYPLPPNLNVTSIAAAPGGIALGTDDGVYYAPLP